VEIVSAVPALQTFSHTVEVSDRVSALSVMGHTRPCDSGIPLIRKARMSGAPGVDAIVFTFPMEERYSVDCCELRRKLGFHAGA
jgi:hypothetical protein